MDWFRYDMETAPHFELFFTLKAFIVSDCKRSCSCSTGYPLVFAFSLNMYQLTPFGPIRIVSYCDPHLFKGSNPSILVDQLKKIAPVIRIWLF